MMMSVFEFDFELPLKMPLGKKLKPVSPSVILFSAKPPKTTIFHFNRYRLMNGYKNWNANFSMEMGGKSLKTENIK